jgi:hypothetical protein
MERRIRKKIWPAIVASMICVTSQAGAIARVTAALPEVPPPPQGQEQWIAKNMRMNGLPMTLKAFQSRLSPDELFNYYESQAYRWGHSEYRRATNRDWRLLGIKSSRHYITVQARATIAGSEGTIAVSPTPTRATVNIVSRFPRPKTARLLSLQEYEDAGIESEHLSLSSPRAVAIEAEAFAQELTRAGWQVIRQQPMQTAARGVVIEAQRGAQQALLTLQRDQLQPSLTAIVVVWRKS